MSLTYKDSGVDVQAGNNFVKKIAPIVKSTFSNRVITEIGGFGALFSASFPELKEPVLVSGTDGVGTKLKIAQLMDKHDTIGIDAVAMCVNDIVTSGAQPLFFLDYLSCGRLNEKIHVEVIRGLAEGCIQAGCSLVGGETAEHPNIMPDDEYDIAGFAVGVVDKSKIINGSQIAPGDQIIGLPSSGIHSNGYSLVRKILLDIKKYDLSLKLNDLNDTLGNTLLAPTRIYVKNIISCINSGLNIKGIVHITGGGFYENIPRILPDQTSALIQKNSYQIPTIFKILQKDGNVAEKEMFTTFNMGIGMILFCDKNETGKIMTQLSNSGENPLIIGEVQKKTDARVIIV